MSQAPHGHLGLAPCIASICRRVQVCHACRNPKPHHIP